MNKKLFFSLIGAIALVMALGSCNGKTKLVNANGYACEVDTFVLNHYSDFRIKQAIERDNYVQSVTLPTNAGSFGQKKAEARWRVFDEDQKAPRRYKVEGEATVNHYEHGLEIVKDGTSWFYDGFEYNEDNLTDISAGRSILHNRWEPVKIGYNGSDLAYRFLYPRNYHGYEEFFIMASDLKDLKISTTTDALIKLNEF